MSDRLMVSIIVSSFNYGRFLRQCIDSALGQTYPGTEVIVVDDASRDDSREIILSYGNRVRALLRETNEGARATYSASCTLGNGDVIIILDSDDMLTPTAVEKAVPLFADPEVVKVHWPLWEIQTHGHKTGRLDPGSNLPDGDLRKDMPIHGPFYHAYPSTSGSAYRKSFMQQYLPLGPGVYVDAYLAMWALVRGKVRRVEEPQGYYRVHGLNTYGNKPFEQRVKKDLAFAELCSRELEAYYRSRGLSVDTNAWKEHSWYHLLDSATRELESLVPQGESCILVDEDNWATQGHVAGRQVMPFPERNGEYGGAPLSDAAAIDECERLRSLGARFLVFAWQAFWWLDYYGEFRRYLDSRYPRVLVSQRLIAYDLTQLRS